MKLVHFDTLCKKLYIVEYEWIWTHLTSECLQRETCQYGHVSRESLINITCANFETWRMKVCTPNSCAMCYYGDMPYRFLYYLLVPCWHKCHEKIECNVLRLQVERTHMPVCKVFLSSLNCAAWDSFWGLYHMCIVLGLLRYRCFALSVVGINRVCIASNHNKSWHVL